MDKEYHKRKYERFLTKLNWMICHHEFDCLDGYSYNYFNFRFHIKNQSILEELIKFLKGYETENELMPTDLANFLYSKNVNFFILFKYIKETGIKSNLIMLRYVLSLDKQILKIYIENNKPIFKREIERKDINGKNRLSIWLKLIFPEQKRMYFVQTDSNIWWKPKKIVKEYEEGKMVSYGWLFSQIGMFVCL